MKTRLCIKCVIGWDKHKHGLACPKCGDDGMATISTGNIGTTQMIHDLGLSHEYFKEFQAEFNHPYEG